MSRNKEVTLGIWVRQKNIIILTIFFILKDSLTFLGYRRAGNATIFLEIY
jgi:hypothetical protein